MPGAQLDISSVDFVSKALVSIALKHPFASKNYHLVSEKLFDFNKFFESAQAFGFPVVKLPYDQWRQKLIDSHNGPENALHPVISLFGESYLAKWRNPHYSRKNTENGKKIIQNTSH